MMFYNFIIKSTLPLSILENEHFKKLISDLTKFKILVPSRTKMNSLIDTQYENYIYQLKKSIETASFLSLNFDIWSKKNENFILTQINITSPDSFLNQLTLDFSLIKDQQASTIKNQLVYLIKLFNIFPEKIISICTDNCNSMKKTGKLFQSFINEEKLSYEDYKISAEKNNKNEETESILSIVYDLKKENDSANYETNLHMDARYIYSNYA